MGRRKKTHHPLAYALLPRFVYVALSQGQIDPTAFTVWATIRLYVRDEERGEFSPAPIDLTNREIAEATGLTIRQTVNVINDLEEVGLLHRLTKEEKAAENLSGSRWLQLHRPQTLQSISMKSVSMKPISLKPEEEATPSSREVDKPSQDSVKKDDFDLVPSSGLEGGVGGTNNHEAHFNETEFNETGFNELGFNETQFREIVRTLQRCHVFRASAFAIAERMLSEDAQRDAQWAEDAFYRVFNEEHGDGVSTEQAMRRTVARLKNGDWGNLDDVAAEARRRKHAAQEQYYDELNQRQASVMKQKPRAASTAQRLWAAVLAEVKLQMTRATFDTWLRDTKCLGFADDNTLIVQAKNTYAVAWLESKLYPVIQRNLYRTVEDWPEEYPDIDLALDGSAEIEITFVLEENVESD
jgi:hypothetical protein